MRSSHCALISWLSAICVAITWSNDCQNSARQLFVLIKFDQPHENRLTFWRKTALDASGWVFANLKPNKIHIFFIPLQHLWLRKTKQPFALLKPFPLSHFWSRFVFVRNLQQNTLFCLRDVFFNCVCCVRLDFVGDWEWS